MGKWENVIKSKDFRVTVMGLVENLKEQIDPDCREEEDDVPSITLTVGMNCSGDWGWQSGDNSYEGGAYGYKHWGVVYITEDALPEDMLRDIELQLENSLGTTPTTKADGHVHGYVQEAMKCSDVLREHKEYKRLIKAVISQLGYDIKEDNDNEDLMVRMSDIRTYGMIVEWNGFAYNIDTVDFYKKNKKDILRLAEEMAESYDEDMFIMIKSFKCLGGDYTTAEIAKALYARNGDYSIQGAIVWAAVEEVANWFDAQIRG